MSSRRPAVVIPPPRAFAIIPAAGESRRMGAPKLLLPLQGSPLIAHAITAWQAAGLAPLVVVRPDDKKLADVCRAYGAEVLIPENPPPEMRVSVRLALEYLQQRYRPPNDFAWLLAPADMPRLSPAIIERLLVTHRLHLQQTAWPPILVPVCGERRGHPVLFPWPMAAQVSSLGPQEGVKVLLTRNQVSEVPCADLLTENQTAFVDVDTPADYEGLQPGSLPRAPMEKCFRNSADYGPT